MYVWTAAPRRSRRLYGGRKPCGVTIACACRRHPSICLRQRARILYSVYILLMFCRSMCTEAYNERNCRRDSPTHCLQGVKWFGQVASGGKANSDGTSSSWRLMSKGSWPFAITLLAVKKGSYDFRALTKTQKMYDILGFEIIKCQKLGKFRVSRKIRRPACKTC